MPLRAGPCTVTVEARPDEIVHNIVRLRICGLLRPVDALTFSTLAATLELTKPALSKHLRILTDAGYTTMSRSSSDERTDRRQITWVRLTREGRRAFDGHVAALRQITEIEADRPGPATV
ncbi:transcriptional regulator [Cellulomonas sp. zg-ZUI188]|uniref:Transcriptional regulator n=1 Tax=Cellulomonas fengjieae TaxID=2819978 RepID=A0ABS3SKL5_9CELL|nr:transcriptional regulator [Cellulomonas fengjieae]QVI65664.1 transcriptional regulator [Cellulomonas fengjieae]